MVSLGEPFAWWSRRSSLARIPGLRRADDVQNAANVISYTLLIEIRLIAALLQIGYFVLTRGQPCCSLAMKMTRQVPASSPHTVQIPLDIVVFVQKFEVHVSGNQEKCIKTWTVSFSGWFCARVHNPPGLIQTDRGKKTQICIRLMLFLSTPLHLSPSAKLEKQFLQNKMQLPAHNMCAWIKLHRRLSN